MAWYDLQENKPTAESRKEYLVRTKYEQIVCLKAQSFQNIIGRELVPMVQYRIVTTQSFNAISVLEYLLKDNDIIEIYMAVTQRAFLFSCPFPPHIFIL